MSSMTTDKIENEVPGMPPAGMRTVASFLIFAHFLALSMVIVGNYRPLSPLRERLRMAAPLMYYARLLNMYTDYAFYLTYGEVLDIDHVLEIDLKSAEGAPETETVRVPEPGMWPLARRQRYLQLNANVATFATEGAQAVESFIPQAIALSAMKEHGADEADVRLRGHRLQSMEDVGSADPAMADPNSERWFNTVYSAKVWWDESGNPQLIKTGSESFSAPTAGPQPAPGSPSAQN